jgi:hypothetical protein
MHTVSRFDSRRVRQKVKLPLFSHGAAWALTGFFNLADAAQRGMFLNAYFQKTEKP